MYGEVLVPQQAIPATGDPVSQTAPKTGDESDPVVWASVLSFSALSLAAVLYFLKRRKA
ncbi:MAG: LPXTG cell wall anchor domain-containing protein [Oscillospiraceae bacterium]|nr:LPXTG cell wall anchor domain-containing protein [Oscillospiraceae bacterium]